MYAAKIKIGWIDQWFEGETPSDVINAVEKYQEFGCLVQMGRMHEDEEGQKELDKLEEFLDKYYSGDLTIEDIKDLHIELSIGDIVCYEIAIGEEAVLKTRGGN